MALPPGPTFAKLEGVRNLFRRHPYSHPIQWHPADTTRSSLPPLDQNPSQRHSTRLPKTINHHAPGPKQRQKLTHSQFQRHPPSPTRYPLGQSRQHTTTLAQHSTNYLARTPTFGPLATRPHSNRLNNLGHYPSRYRRSTLHGPHRPDGATYYRWARSATP